MLLKNDDCKTTFKGELSSFAGVADLDRVSKMLSIVLLYMALASLFQSGRDESELSLKIHQCCKTLVISVKHTGVILPSYMNSKGPLSRNQLKDSM